MYLNIGRGFKWKKIAVSDGEYIFFKQGFQIGIRIISVSEKYMITDR
jgi:hypothetical protein